MAHLKRCSRCALNYPSVYPGRCVVCEGALGGLSDADAEPMTEAEFKHLREMARLRRGDEPAALTPVERHDLGADLDAFLDLYRDLEAEAARRGPRWTASDVYEERLSRDAA